MYYKESYYLEVDVEAENEEEAKEKAYEEIVEGNYNGSHGDDIEFYDILKRE